MKKILRSALSAVLCALLMCSCASKNAYRNDVPCSAVTNAIEKKLAADGGYVYYGDEELGFIFGEAFSLAKEDSVVYSLVSQNIDEFGIFLSENESDARKLTDICYEYLKEKYENENAFIASYAPEELPKLKNAEAKRFGNYVAFAILSENDRALFFDKVEEMLRQN